MFDIGAQEILLILVVAVLVIGPKDMPAALRLVGRWIGKLRRVSGQFRSGLDGVIREAEMEEMEKKWKSQNDKVMRDHPEGSPEEMEQTGAYPAAKPPTPGASADAAAVNEAADLPEGPAALTPAPTPPTAGTSAAGASAAGASTDSVSAESAAPIDNAAERGKKVE